VEHIVVDGGSSDAEAKFRLPRHWRDSKAVMTFMENLESCKVGNV